MKQMVMGMVMAGLLCSGAMGAAEERPVIELWPDGAPGALGQADQDKPTIQVYHPTSDSAGGTAVVICPGGGYSGLAMDHEGRQIAEWFNSVGVTAFILSIVCRPGVSTSVSVDGCPGRFVWCGHVPGMEDQSRSDRDTRFSAGASGLDRGTHLSTGSHGKRRCHRCSLVSSGFRLIYPVISMGSAIVHRGSRNNLLGGTCGGAAAAGEQ